MLALELSWLLFGRPIEPGDCASHGTGENCTDCRALQATSRPDNAFACYSPPGVAVTTLLPDHRVLWVACA